MEFFSKKVYNYPKVFSLFRIKLMKKLFVILVFSLFVLTHNLGFCADNLKENIATVKSAITYYKAQNYLECINILSEYIKKYDFSAAAHYYLGCAYMRIGLAEKAKENFERTADINTVPQLTSYSLQAVNCIENSPAPCEYYKLTKKQIVELQADPSGYIENLRNNLLAEETVEGVDEEIEKLIHGTYDKVHPEAAKVLLDERMKKDKYNLNKKGMLPVSNKLAKAIRATYPHSYAPSAKSATSEVTADEMELIIMSETAALKK